MTSPPTIGVESVSFRTSGTTLLDDVTCTAPAGALTGIIGPNGSGKTTMISLIARWQKPTIGRITLDGRPVDAWRRRDYARRVAAVEQHSDTELDLTVEQVVGLGAIPHGSGWGSPVDRRTDVTEHLDALAITGLRHRTWRTLSGGERQRTHVARAFAQRSAVLLLDEPTNHLDPAAAVDLLAAVRDSHHTVVAALHDLSSAAMFCDHLVVLRAGRIVAEGTPDEVLTTELLADVYGLDAEIVPHPRTGRPMVVVCGTVGEERR
ncbi:ABC transporter ATP-binding protein [Gordonia humi]|uniref:Iron complex transport system ATP-binding protein n=1 Tax=Gordonia humi TaxID=686429 RepID=A0A840FDB8_9ACTN|nr:ABC transporter ATP-binding protein [Gordonia humi]MBB4137467.1 iron complex transport system ATP-binding protein [Gordonia humi]